MKGHMIMSRYGPQIRWRRVAPLIAALLSILALPASADPPHVPQTSHLLPGDGGSFPALADQTTPSIAAGNGGFLAVWTDERSTVLAGGGTGKDIYAARLAGDGSVIDTIPIVVTRAAGDQYDPTAVWNGTDWLVIWTGTVVETPYPRHNTEGARVSGDGALLDAQPFEIWEFGDSGEHVVGAASDGQNWAVVMTDIYVNGLSTNTRLVGRKISSTGVVTGAPYYLYSPACCSFFWRTGMAYAGGTYMVVFEGYVDSWNYGIFGLRLSPGLTTLDSYPVVLTEIAMQSETRFYASPTITSDGSTFYVAWDLWHRFENSQVYGARIMPDGTSLDGNGVPISGVLPENSELQPTANWDGTHWVVGWPQGAQLQLARVSGVGIVVDPGGVASGLPLGTSFTGPAAGLQVAYAEARHADTHPFDAVTAHLDPDLAVGPVDVVSLGAPMQLDAAIAHGTLGALIVSASRTADAAHIVAQLVDDMGEAIGASPLTLAAGTVAHPDVAWDGTRYLVAWDDGDSVMGTRISATGDLLDATPVALLAGIDPAISGRTQGFLVASTATSGAQAVRVDGDGTVVDATPLMLGAGLASHAAAAALDDLWLTVWEQDGAPDGGDVMLSAVNDVGAVVGPIPVTTLGDGLATRHPAIAVGDSILVAWEDGRNGTADIYGRRYSSGLTVADPAGGVALVMADDDQLNPAVAWDGVRFISAFDDTRDRTTSLDHAIAVYRSWASAYGPIAETTGLPLFSGDTSAAGAAVTGDAGNQIYVASVFHPEQPFAATRLEVRFAGRPTAVDAVPSLTRLLPAYPNPANPATNIRFTLARAGDAVIDIFDTRGRHIRSLQGTGLTTGAHAMLWNGTDVRGEAAPSGTYLYRLRAEGMQATGKLSLVR